MPERNTAIALVFAAPLVAGCVSSAVVEEISAEEAGALGDRLPNPGLGAPRGYPDAPIDVTKDPRLLPKPAERKESHAAASARAMENLWMRIQVGSAILAKEAEKFEEGSLQGRSPSGETFEGTFLGYRPRATEHCTRSWISNLYYFNTAIHFRPEGGVAVLKGDRGTPLLCAYGWIRPGCGREGVCKAKESKYYKLQF